MKYTIEGFSQEYALTFKKRTVFKSREREIKLDCTDLVILRWFVDFYPNMDKKTINGREYAWLLHKKMIADLPILDISVRGCCERMQKLVEFGILDSCLVKDGGTFSLYTFGPNYAPLIDTDKKGVDVQTYTVDVQASTGDVQASTGSRSSVVGVDVQASTGSRSNVVGGDVQTSNKDNSIIDTSIKNESIKDASTRKRVRGKKKSTCASAAVEPTRKTYGSFSNVLLSDEEFDRLRTKFPVDYERRIERLSAYMASTGKGYDNHCATIIAWATEDAAKQEAEKAAPAQSSGNPFLDALRKQVHNYQERESAPETYGALSYSDPTKNFD